MKAYVSQSREELGLTRDEWEELQQFVDTIHPIIDKETENEPVESPPPHFIHQQSTKPTKFSPGGWVGRYPGGITVLPSPNKLNRYEYEGLISDLAGWIELRDVPTARAMLPLVQTETLERRRILLGYSDALIAFTEEATAHRPPVTVNRQPEVGDKPRGTLDIDRTVQQRAGGSQSVAYQKLRFSFDHPLNLLLLQFHVDLSRELEELIEDSLMTDSMLKKNQAYHQQFVQSEFSPELLDKALATDFADPSFLDTARQESSNRLAELIDLWESYRRNQSLSISIERKLNVGIKPVEKVYEMWVLTVIMDCLSEVLETEPTRPDDSLREFRFTPEITLHYNKSLEEYSRILAPGFNANPGRPDYAISIGDDIVWIGDAKYSPMGNIGLQDYQRLLSYTVDLMPASAQPTATLFYVRSSTIIEKARTSDYTIEKLPLRPRSKNEQRPLVIEQLSRCLPH